jgi:hypothetical protein
MDDNTNKRIVALERQFVKQGLLMGGLGLSVMITSAALLIHTNQAQCPSPPIQLGDLTRAK